MHNKAFLFFFFNCLDPFLPCKKKLIISDHFLAKKVGGEVVEAKLQLMNRTWTHAIFY